MSFPLTFVTAYLTIYDADSKNKSKEMRFEHFERLARTKIPIVVFIDKDSSQGLESFYNDSNLRIVHVNFKELETYKETMEAGPPKELPGTRCQKKDTLEFMILMNAKAEFMKLAMDLNFWESTHYCWLDFSLSYIFKQMDETLKYFQWLQNQTLRPKLFAIPGCWDKGMGSSYWWQAINWRFCGGFFVADKESLHSFYTLYRKHYKKMLMDSGRMIWETNIWHMFEVDGLWSPDWFKADHNDSICHLPASFFS